METPGKDSARQVRTALAAYAAVLLFCFAASTVAAALWVRAGHAGWPHGSWLYWPEYRFSDFWEYAEQSRHIGDGFFQHQGRHGPFAYNAPAAFLFAAFVKPFGADLRSGLGFYLAFFALCFAAFMATLWLASRAPPRGVALWPALLLSAAFSYPAWFLADRGNIEGMLWVFVAAGVFFWCRGKDLVAALFLGLAIACKFVYAPLLLLFVPRRRWPPLLLALGLASALTVLSLHALGPTAGEAWHKISGTWNLFGQRYFLGLREWELGFNHSLFGLLKQAVFTIHGYEPFYYSPYYYERFNLVLMYGMYKAVVFALAAGLYLGRVVALPRLNQLFFLIVSFLLFAPVSSDYKLVYLYLPWGLFLLFLARDVAPGRAAFGLRQQLLVLVPCAVCFSPQHLIMQGWPVGGQIKCLALLALLYAAAKFPMPCSAAGDADWKPRSLRGTFHDLAAGFAPWLLRAAPVRRWLAAEGAPRENGR